MQMWRNAFVVAFVTLLQIVPAVGQQLDPTTDQVESALRRAAEYFRATVSTRGGYLWVYSEDLSHREGEVEATATQIWVQPPGTPSVGFTYLKAYGATGDAFYLDCAKAASDALVWGQLESGGWDYKIDFGAVQSGRWYYRRDQGNLTDKESAHRHNISTFDDNTTQSALRFLIAVDKACRDTRYVDTVNSGLNLLLRSQFENGAWPQRYPLNKSNYSRYYTFNDNAINDCIEVMFDAYHAYGDERYLESAKRGGDFIIASQLPAPQSGWAQQYSWDMQPAPARWFEPAACNGLVTSRNIATLISLYERTGEGKYLEPIPAAIDWLDRSKMGDGTWARFYELETNRPVYVNMDREVVYEFVNIRPGYGWKGNFGIPSVIAEYRKLKEMGRERYRAANRRTPSAEANSRKMAAMRARVVEIINSLDDSGRWVESGQIRCSTFNSNVAVLCAYIEIAEALGEKE